MQSVFSRNKFFKEQADTLDQNTIGQLLRSLRYVEYQAGELIFKYGD